MKLKLNPDARIFLPFLAVASALRLAFDIQHGNWAFARGLLSFFDWLFPCVALSGVVAFFWRLFRTKTY